MRKAFVLVCGVIICAVPCRADYNKTCMQSLARSVVQQQAFTDYRKDWDEQMVRSLLDLRRTPTDTEYEAIMDATHELPVKVTLDNGRELLLKGRDSLRLLKPNMVEHEIVGAEYLPRSRKKLGGIFKEVCVLLGRSPCDVYDNYRGWLSKGSHPLTQLEEQAVKWCTFHMVPSDDLVESMHEVKEQMGSVEDLEQAIYDVHIQSRQAQLKFAFAIIRATFDDHDTALLYLSFVHPYLSAAYERVYQLYLGNLARH